VDPIIYTILATDGCPEQFRTVRKIHHRPKSKDTGCAFNGLPILDCLQKLTVPAQTEDGKDRGEDESLTSTPKALTHLQQIGPSVTHPANHLQNALKINEMVRVSPNNENNDAAMGSVQFAQHTNRAKA
jgi:hypothetical protein